MEAESLEKCSNRPKSEWKHGCVFQVGSGGGKQKLFKVAACKSSLYNKLGEVSETKLVFVQRADIVKGICFLVF